MKNSSKLALASLVLLAAVGCTKHDDTTSAPATPPAAPAAPAPSVAPDAAATPVPADANAAVANPAPEATPTPSPAK